MSDHASPPALLGAYPDDEELLELAAAARGVVDLIDFYGPGAEAELRGGAAAAECLLGEFRAAHAGLERWRRLGYGGTPLEGASGCALIQVLLGEVIRPLAALHDQYQALGWPMGETVEAACAAFGQLVRNRQKVEDLAGRLAELARPAPAVSLGEAGGWWEAEGAELAEADARRWRDERSAEVASPAGAGGDAQGTGRPGVCPELGAPPEAERCEAADALTVLARVIDGFAEMSGRLPHRSAYLCAELVREFEGRLAHLRRAAPRHPELGAAVLAELEVLEYYLADVRGATREAPGGEAAWVSERAANRAAAAVRNLALRGARLVELAGRLRAAAALARRPEVPAFSAPPNTPELAALPAAEPPLAVAPLARTEDGWVHEACALLVTHRERVASLGDLYQLLRDRGYPHSRESLYKHKRLLAAAASIGIYQPRGPKAEAPRGTKVGGVVEARDYRGPEAV